MDVAPLVRMSVPGQSRGFDRVPTTSAVPPQTDIVTVRRHVSKANIGSARAVFDHLVGGTRSLTCATEDIQYVAAVGECPAFHRRKRVAKMDVNACSRRAAERF